MTAQVVCKPKPCDWTRLNELRTAQSEAKGKKQALEPPVLRGVKRRQAPARTRELFMLPPPTCGDGGFRSSAG